MRNLKRLLVLVAFTTAIGVASFAVEEEVNAQTAGSAGSGPSPSAGTSPGGSTSAPTAGSGTTTTSSTEEKKDSGGCSVAAPASDAGLGALVGLALGVALWRRRKDA
ncbi:MAG TPA: JDVT-CTERM domain-containing protein [Polyangiaceae bacterium]|nr:JDVT-CTERM domain-containing protein [Polyangiaceae bacterium]